jgi:hypothetical protein
VADDVDAWAGDQRAQAAADARSRERWLRQQALEAADLAAVLVDLAEQHQPVLITLSTGRQHHGTPTGVGVDFVSLAGPGGLPVYLAIAAITVVKPAPGSAEPPAATGDTRGPVGGRLAHLLADAAADRPRLMLGLVGGETVSGELRSVGTDVVTLLRDGDPPWPIYVRLDSVCDASFFGSG